MNSAEPGGKEETGEGRAVGAGRGAVRRPPIPRPPEPPRGEGRVTFRRRVRRLRSRFRWRRWEEPGGPRRRPRALLLPRPRARRPPSSRPATSRVRALAARPGRCAPTGISRVPPPLHLPPQDPASAFPSCLGRFQRPRQREETQTMI